MATSVTNAYIASNAQLKGYNGNWSYQCFANVNLRTAAPATEGNCEDLVKDPVKGAQEIHRLIDETILKQLKVLDL